MMVKDVFTGRGDLQVDGTLEGNILIEGTVHWPIRFKRKLACWDNDYLMRLTAAIL